MKRQREVIDWLWMKNIMDSKETDCELSSFCRTGFFYLLALLEVSCAPEKLLLRHVGCSGAVRDVAWRSVRETMIQGNQGPFDQRCP